MEKFSQVIKRAAERKGGLTALQHLTSKPLSDKELASVDDNLILAEMTRKVFQSGFVWAVVNKKWDGFRDVFWEFEIKKIIMMPDDMLERKASDPLIIRNYTKVKTVRDNAIWLNNLSHEVGHLGTWFANWPKDDVIGLWAFLKKNGSRLGGNTGPYTLRALGVDTFILSRDVESYFRAHNLIEGGLTSKRNLKIIQNAFNQWQVETGLSYQELSQILAYSVGDNYVGLNVVE